MINDLEQWLGRITSILKEKSYKIVCSCRLEIFKDKKKCNSLSILNRFCLDLSSNEFGLVLLKSLILLKFTLSKILTKIINCQKDTSFTNL